MPNPVGWRGLLAAVAFGCTAMLADAASAGSDAAACLAGSEDPQKTVDHCTRAIDGGQFAADKLPLGLNLRGLAWLAQAKLDKAGADFDEALRLNPDYAWAYNNRAVVWTQRGDFDRAIADYDRAIALRPNYAFALSNRGGVWLAKGDVERALADEDAAVRLMPPQVEVALTSRGRALMAKNDFAGAIAAFDAALDKNPNYVNALIGRGYARFCQGKFDDAAADFILSRRIRHESDGAIALIIASRRGGHDGQAELGEVKADFEGGVGLPAGLALYAGAITPDQALQSAVDANPRSRQLRVCAINFQVAEWYLLLEDPARARLHFNVARVNCDMSQPEFAAASAELKRLK